MDESFSTSHLSGSSPTMLETMSHPDSPGSPGSPRTPGSTPRHMMSPNQCHTVVLFSTPIAAIYIDGKERLCLAQISNTLLRKFSYNEIHNRRVALGVTCVQCTPVQLEMLRRAGAMPVSSRRCGMITKREAERLCKSFLCESRPPKLPENFAFDVYHECAWGCRGDFVPSRYNSSRAKCIKCCYCGLYFSPNKFIFHTHRIADSKYRPPDAANFNSWRRHIHLVDRSPDEDLLQAWEDVKAMFNGGSRKRSNPPSSSSQSSSLQSNDAISATSPPMTKRKRQSLNYGQDVDPVIKLRPNSMDPRLDYFLSAATMGSNNIHTPQPNRPSTPSVEENSMAAAQLYANSTAKLRQQFSAHAFANRNLYAEYLSSGGKLPYPLAASFWPKTPSLMPPLGAHFPRDLPPFDLKALADQRVHSLSKESLALADLEGNSRDDEALRDLENWEKARFSLAERHFNLRDIKIPGKAEFHYGSAFRPVMANGVELSDSAMSLRSQSGESTPNGDPSSFLHHIAKKSNHDPSPADIFRITESFPNRDHQTSTALPTRQADFARYFLDDKPWGRDAANREGTAFLWRQQREKRLDDLLFRVARKECERKSKNGEVGEGRTNQSSVIQDAEASTSCESPDSKLKNGDMGVGMTETEDGKTDEPKTISSSDGHVTNVNRSPSPDIDVDIIHKGSVPTTSVSSADDLNVGRLFCENSPQNVADQSL